MTQLEIPWFRPARTMQQLVPTTEPKYEACVNLDAPMANGRKLYPHQKESVQRLLNGNLILALDMGLGKTAAALMAAKILYEQQKFQTIIVCPANLIQPWRDEAELVGHTKISVYSFGKQPTEDMVKFHDYVLIGDEAHGFSNLKAQRTQRFLELAQCAERVWCLTGTPMANARPANIFPLLRACGHPLSKNQKLFEERFCGATLQKRPFKRPTTGCRSCNGSGKSQGRTCHCRMVKIWDVTGATHTDELRTELLPVMLRKKKSECLELPPKTRVLRDVEIKDEDQSEYERVIALCRARYQAKLASGEVRSWKSDGVLTGDGEAMQILSALRMASSMAGVPSTIELLEEIVDQGDQALCFTMFVESAKAIAEHFKVQPFISGQQDKKQIVLDLNSGKSRIFCGTMQSGGTGLNLQAANYVLLHDRDYVPGCNAQAEDRSHRGGQEKEVTSYWMRRFDVCRTIDDLLLKKEQIIAQVLEGSDEAIRGGGAVTATQVLSNLFR